MLGISWLSSDTFLHPWNGAMVKAKGLQVSLRVRGALKAAVAKITSETPMLWRRIRRCHSDSSLGTAPF